jgi:transcription factor C subunit 7
MPVQEIILLRHGHRLAWTFNPQTGTYTSTHPFPTRLPADPPLASHGVRQSRETATYLSELLLPQIKDDRLVIYSSLFYRCLETLRPSVAAFQHLGWKGKVRGERGVGEWFGSAPFEQPTPGALDFLRDRFFPWLEERQSLVVPNNCGESIDGLHDRVSRVLKMIIKEVDREYERNGRGEEAVTVLICGHAAGVIASGRVLTGDMPNDYAKEDFKCFTCGLSRFASRGKKPAQCPDEEISQKEQSWRTDSKVAGGWDCFLNSGCEHLSQGEERGWHFNGDESFDSYGPPQGPSTEKKPEHQIEDKSEKNTSASKL